MAHLVEKMAYAGKTPWHGLGNVINPGDSIEVCREKGGLTHEVNRALVEFAIHGGMSSFENQYVLFRSDNNQPLSVVSDRYKYPQPAEIVEFYRDLCDNQGYQLDTLGSLDGGKKIWALAKTGQSFTVGKDDAVNGYLLLATSYDKTMATIAKFTSIRVVCNNTLSLARAGGADVSVRHLTTFDADQVKIDLGVKEDIWADFEMDAKLMHAVKVNKMSEVAHFYSRALYGDKADAEKLLKDGDRRLLHMMETFRHGAGQEPTVWGLLNGATGYVDHVAGRGRDTALNSAWFGQGANLKDRAYSLAKQIIQGNDGLLQEQELKIEEIQEAQDSFVSLMSKTANINNENKLVVES